MAIIQFPKNMHDFLTGSPLLPGIQILTERVSEIVTANKTVFFPYYTDHGIDHIQQVLNFEVSHLIPKEVWPENGPQHKLLKDADAAIIIGATLLHDLAMHLQPAGFLELVSPGSRFKPVRWFNQDSDGHTADRPWHELWDDYCREAQRFSDRDLATL